jgi:anti-sigma factor ChrR (cupin superfamily)
VPLHQFRNERVSLLRWAPDTPWGDHSHDGGEEILVLEGSFSDEYGDYPAGTWLRYPDGSSHSAIAGNAGALLYLKTGHLLL